jgi:MraZ protein
LPFFVGQCTSTIDDKNRMVIPAKMRQAAGEDGERGYYLTQGAGGCIAIFTATRFEQVSAESAAKTVEIDADVDRARAVFAEAEFAKCDKQGRLVLPAHLLDELGIGKNILVCGNNDRIEVWDAVRWPDVRKASKELLAKRAKEAEQKRQAPEE